MMIDMEQVQNLTEQETTEIFVQGAFGDKASQWAAGTLLYSLCRYSEAYEWLELAAAQGHEPSILLMANMLIEGLGVKRNMRNGHKLIKQLAAAGNAEAQFALGMLFSKGRGVRKNVQKARGWFADAANQGHAKAMIMIGMDYFLGEEIEGNDLQSDPLQGLVWMERAALKGSKEAVGLAAHFSRYLTRKEILEARAQARGLKLLWGGRR